MMGYDRAITMFSPDGRLLQVEYAKKTVKQGSTTIGMVCKDGVLLVADKRIVDTLVVAESVEKVFQIDKHIGATASGIISDARVLIDRAQLKAQQHRVTYDAPIDTLSIVKDMCSIKQLCTQSGGLRPFGVSILVAGIDNGKGKLYETDPTGIFFEYRASVIGEGEEEVENMLHSEYKDTLSIEEGIMLTVKALAKLVGKDFNANRLDIAYIKNDKKKFTKMSRDELNSIVSKVKKK